MSIVFYQGIKKEVEDIPENKEVINKHYYLQLLRTNFMKIGNINKELSNKEKYPELNEDTQESIKNKKIVFHSVIAYKSEFFFYKLAKLYYNDVFSLEEIQNTKKLHEEIKNKVMQEIEEEINLTTERNTHIRFEDTITEVFSNHLNKHANKIIKSICKAYAYLYDENTLNSTEINDKFYSIPDSRIYHCYKCKTNFTIEHTTAEGKVTCPSCSNQDIPQPYTTNILYMAKLFNDYPKLKISLIGVRFTIKRNKLYSHKFRCRYIINASTKNTYFMYNIKKNTGGQVNASLYNINNSYICQNNKNFFSHLSRKYNIHMHEDAQTQYNTILDTLYDMLNIKQNNENVKSIYHLAYSLSKGNKEVEGEETFLELIKVDVYDFNRAPLSKYKKALRESTNISEFLKHYAIKEINKPLSNIIDILDKKPYLVYSYLFFKKYNIIYMLDKMPELISNKLFLYLGIKHSSKKNYIYGLKEAFDYIMNNYPKEDIIKFFKEINDLDPKLVYSNIFNKLAKMFSKHGYDYKKINLKLNIKDANNFLYQLPLNNPSGFDDINFISGKKIMNYPLNMVNLFNSNKLDFRILYSIYDISEIINSPKSIMLWNFYNKKTIDDFLNQKYIAAVIDINDDYKWVVDKWVVVLKRISNKKVTKIYLEYIIPIGDNTTKSIDIVQATFIKNFKTWYKKNNILIPKNSLSNGSFICQLNDKTKIFSDKKYHE